MARPFTLFTGQWADLPLEEVCRLASSWGYDGLELACWGDHFEVDRAVAEPGYAAPAPLTPLVAHPLRGEGKWRVLDAAARSAAAGGG